MKVANIVRRYSPKVHINDLTLEVLIVVLSIAISSCEKKYQYRRYRAPWLMLRAVCRLWRDMIDGSPVFWTTIVDPLSEGYVKMVLQNSSAVRSLSVFGKLDHHRDLAPSLLRPKNHITELCFKIADTTSLNSIICVEWPCIQAVQLSSSRASFHIHTQLPLHHSFFRAHTLALNRIEIPISSLSSFQDLRSLKLRYDRLSIPFSLPVIQFLHMLRTQEHLELMKLTANFDVTSDSPSLPRVQLPSLTTLHLEAPMGDAVLLLSCIRLPLLRRLRLTVDQFDHDDHRTIIFFKLARVLSTAMGFSPTVIQTCSTGLFYEQSTAISITCGDSNAYFRLSSNNHSLPIARHIACAIRGFEGSHILTLELDAYCDYYSKNAPSMEPVTSWIDVLTALPNLTDIFVSHSGYAVENLPIALESFTPRGLVCPRFTNLHFAEGTFRPTQCEAWTHCLFKRQTHGVTLSVLTFRNWTFPADFWVDRFDNLCHILINDTIPQTPREDSCSETEDEEESYTEQLQRFL